MYAYVKNKFIKESEASVSIQERGFRFGDGFFDTILINNFQPYQWQYHKIKIQKGISYFKIDVNIEYIEKLAKKLIIKNKFENGLLRISISRGIGSRGYQPLIKIKPTIVIETINNKSRQQDNNSHLWVSKYKKIPASCINPNIKLMSGAQNIICKIEALEQNCCDALMLNHEGLVCEGASSNIFWIKDNKIYTSSSNLDIYQGSVRNAIIDLFPNTQELQLSISDLTQVDEIFLTNVGFGINSISLVKNLSTKKLTNKITTKIIQKLKQDIKEKTRHFHAW